MVTIMGFKLGQSIKSMDGITAVNRLKLMGVMITVAA